MARNSAKRFANMKLLYWKPIVDGSCFRYEYPVVFSGKYIGNAQIGADSGIVFSGGNMRSNMVLFYGCVPEVEGYVCWTATLDQLKADGLDALPPDQIAGTHKIDEVNTYVMPSAKTATLETQAFIASVV